MAGEIVEIVVVGKIAAAADVMIVETVETVDVVMIVETVETVETVVKEATVRRAIGAILRRWLQPQEQIDFGSRSVARMALRLAI